MRGIETEPITSISALQRDLRARSPPRQDEQRATSTSSEAPRSRRRRGGGCSVVEAVVRAVSCGPLSIGDIKSRAGDAEMSLVVPTFISLDDPRRLAELRHLAILDTPPESEYDDLAVLAAAVCRSSVGAVNFVDDERHFTKAIAGLPEARGGNVSNDVSLCAATVESADGVLVIPHTHADERWRDHPLVTAGPQVGFYAGVSIVSRGQRVGVVCAFGSESRDVSEEERAGLAALARQAAGQLDLRRRNAELHDLVVTDALTGVANRTLLFDHLELALANRARAGGEVGVLFCDVDGFKAVNDRFGHEAGDRLLCDIAAYLRAESRMADTVARIAGDEFVLVCPRLGSTTDLAGLAARVAGASHGRRKMPDGSLPPRLSVGAVLARHGERPADVLRRADAAMYADKAARRARQAAA